MSVCIQLRGCLNRGRHSKNLLARLFVGQHGVRAGWRAALFLLAMAAQLFLIVMILRVVLHATARHGVQGGLTPLLLGLNELGLLLPACGASALMAWLENTSLMEYGLRDPKKRVRLGVGFAVGVVALAALMLGLSAGGFSTGQGGGLSLAGDIGYALKWLCVSLLTGVTEEFAFRGYLLTSLQRGIGFFGAACLTSLVFGALHGINPGEAPLGLLNTVGAGLLFCLFIRRTGSLWFAIGFHGAWDYAENFLFGTADSGAHCVGTLSIFVPRGNVYLSGGMAGPEGSLFCTLILLLIALLTLKFMRPATLLAAPHPS
jgi:uncharacterized protein